MHKWSDGREHIGKMPESVRLQVAQVDAIWKRIGEAFDNNQPVEHLFKLLDQLYGRSHPKRLDSQFGYDWRGGEAGRFQADHAYQQRKYRSRRPRKRRA